jgi:CBS domain-containing protein
MIVARLIRDRGEVVTVGPRTPVTDVIRTLHEYRIGAVLVMEGERIAGVLSERDVVRCLAEEGGEALGKTAGELMTADVITTHPDESVTGAMGHMTRRRIRHLPVVENGRLIGIVSIGDLVKARIEEVEHEAESLKEYIQQA